MTLNQIIGRIATLALAHKQVRSFYFGDIASWLAKGSIEYPAVFLSIGTGRIDKANKLTTYTVELWISDQTNVSENAQGNDTEVLSDLTAIAEDLQAMMNWEEFEDWAPDDSSSFAYFREKFNDWTAAIRLTLDLSVFYKNDRCRIPTEFFGGGLLPYIVTEDGQFILTEQGETIKIENA